MREYNYSTMSFCVAEPFIVWTVTKYTPALKPLKLSWYSLLPAAMAAGMLLTTWPAIFITEIVAADENAELTLTETDPLAGLG